jgi:hypothetical protein
VVVFIFGLFPTAESRFKARQPSRERSVFGQKRAQPVRSNSAEKNILPAAMRPWPRKNDITKKLNNDLFLS